MNGKIEFLDQKEVINHWKAKGLDFSKLFYDPDPNNLHPKFCCEDQNHYLEKVLDRELINLTKNSIDNHDKIKINMPISNFNRSTGAMLSGFISKKYGFDGLKENSLHIKFKGTTGQAFGAWLCNGVLFEVEGEANDYVGKGLSGGNIVVYPPKNADLLDKNDSIIVGNTVLYGAIAGKCFFRGFAGERFAVRNSGAVAVVEGLGDHGCEYMTGGVVLCIGKTGKNFGAGMSGGLAYVFDKDNNFSDNCNFSLIELLKINNFKKINKKILNRNFLNANMLNYHVERIYYLLTRHFSYTNSKVAFNILSNFDDAIKNFKLVLPTDYKRALSNDDQIYKVNVRKKG